MNPNKDVIPPKMVCSHLVLPRLMNPREGILGDLEFLFSVSTSRNKERNYLERRWIMSPSRRQGILFVAESSNLPKKPTCGYRDRRPGLLPEGRSLDDWMLE